VNITLKWVLEIQDWTLWYGFVWFRIQISVTTKMKFGALKKV